MLTMNPKMPGRNRPARSVSGMRTRTRATKGKEITLTIDTLLMASIRMMWISTTLMASRRTKTQTLLT